MELSSVLGRLCIHGDDGNPDQKTFFCFWSITFLGSVQQLHFSTRESRGERVFWMQEIKSPGADASAREIPASPPQKLPAAPSSPHPCNSEVCLWFFDAATSLAHSLSSALWVYLWQIIEPRGTWFQWRLLCFSGKSRRERALRRRQLSVEGGNGAELLPCSLAAIDQRFSCCATPTTARILPLPCPGINTKVRK